jgi:hypothetical protein
MVKFFEVQLWLFFCQTRLTCHNYKALLTNKCCKAERITTPQFGVRSVDMPKYEDKRLETLTFTIRDFFI